MKKFLDTKISGSVTSVDITVVLEDGTCAVFVPKEELDSASIKVEDLQKENKELKSKLNKINDIITGIYVEDKKKSVPPLTKNGETLLAGIEECRISEEVLLQGAQSILLVRCLDECPKLYHRKVMSNQDKSRFLKYNDTYRRMSCEGCLMNSVKQAYLKVIDNKVSDTGLL